MIGKKTAVSVAVIFVAVYMRHIALPGKELGPVVSTKHGDLLGIVARSRDGRKYFSYLGVPYAKPPVGDLRFEPPVPLDEKWSGIRDATEYGSKCIQLDLLASRIDGHEECLFINIHSPNISDSLPVMVFIHGGLFIFGSGDMYRPEYFMDENIVLVTFNYRLASFGFLNSGDGVVRGNMGLKDQVAALQWVKENIRNFGGDPKKVTIFGESAGGASVHYQILSPMSKGLFSKAISQSGLATNPWALTDPSLIQPQFQKFASNLNCLMTSVKETVACMKNLTFMEVVSGHLGVADPLRQLIDVFVPTVEMDIPDGQTFLAEHPMEILKRGDFNKVPSIIGFNSDEGLLNSAVIARNESLIETLRRDMEKFLPRLLYLDDGINATVLNQLKEYYSLPNGLAESLEDLKNYTNMFTDRFWLTDLTKAVTLQSQVAKVYLYYYTYRTEFTLTDFVLALKGQMHPLVEILAMSLKNLVKKHILGETLPNFGICHSDELSLQFYMPLLAKISPNHRDYSMSKEIVKLWVQFAEADIDPKENTISPRELQFLGQNWPPQDPTQPLKYFQLDSQPKIVFQPNHDRIKFWNSLGLTKH